MLKKPGDFRHLAYGVPDYKNVSIVGRNRSKGMLPPINVPVSRQLSALSALPSVSERLKINNGQATNQPNQDRRSFSVGVPEEYVKVIQLQPVAKKIGHSREPVDVQCPLCNENISTQVKYEKTCGVWITFTVFLIFCLP